MYTNPLIIIIAAALILAVPIQVDATQKQHRQVVQTKTLRTLPAAHHRISHRGKSYYYSAGRFYRQGNGGYITITAPFGAVVPALPRGYVSFGIGINRYFYFDGIYYQHVNDGYEVVKKPKEAEQLASSGSDKLIVYPAADQSDELREKDRYECHLWASEESQFDPTDAESDPVLRADYRRALTACLEAKGYIVK